MPQVITRRPVTVSNTRSGFINGAERTIKNDYIVNYGFSSKSVPIKSDYRTPTNYSRTESQVTADDPVVVRVKTGNENYLDSRYLSPGLPDPQYPGYPTGFYPKLDNEYQKVKVAALNGLRQPERFNTSVSVAEAKATAEMLADTGGKMAMAIKNFRRYLGTLPRNAREAALAAAGQWLKGYYGYGSLARDAFDLNAKLRSKMDDPLRLSSSASSSVTQTSFFEDPGYRKHSSSYIGTARAKFSATITNGFARDMDAWGLTNPLLVAWELVPFSFCVDWLIPIGNTLDSLTATMGLQFDLGHGSLTTTGTSDIVEGFASNVVSQGRYTKRIKFFDRMRLTAFPAPTLYANQNPFSTPRIISGSALITQAILGR